MGLARMNIATPPGLLSWVVISGVGADNYNKDGKVYKATITYPSDSPQCLALKKKINDFWKENLPKESLKSLGYTALKDKETKQLTGFTEFKFDTKTTWPEDEKGVAAPKVIKVYNAGNKAKNQKPSEIFLGDKRVGNDSIGAISGIAGIYINGREAGVSLYINSLQLIDFKEFSEETGFEAADAGGYQGDDKTVDETSGFEAAESGDPVQGGDPIQGELVTEEGGDPVQGGEARPRL